MTTPSQASSRRVELVVKLIVDTMIMHGYGSPHAPGSAFNGPRFDDLPYGSGMGWSHVNSVLYSCVHDRALLDSIADEIARLGWYASVRVFGGAGLTLRIGEPVGIPFVFEVSK